MINAINRTPEEIAIDLMSSMSDTALLVFGNEIKQSLIEAISNLTTDQSEEIQK